MNIRNISCIVIILCWLNSCHHYCATVTFGSVGFLSFDSLTDSSATVIKCEKGSNYSMRLDSAFLPIVKNSNVYGPFKAGFTYDFSDAGKDYLIIVRPSGRIHHVTNINYGHEKDGGGCGGSNATKC